LQGRPSKSGFENLPEAPPDADAVLVRTGRDAGVEGGWVHILRDVADHLAQGRGDP